MSYILYIPDLNEEPEGQIFQAIKKLNPNRNIETEKFNLFDIEGTLSRIKEKNPDVLIGNGLGGFYPLACQTSYAKLVINPCLKPWEQFSENMAAISPALVDEFKAKYEYLDYWVDMELRFVTFGLFSKNDQKYNYLNEYTKLYRSSVGGVDNILTIPENHSLFDDGILEENLRHAFTYHELGGMQLDVQEHYDFIESEFVNGYSPQHFYDELNKEIKLRKELDDKNSK